MRYLIICDNNRHQPFFTNYFDSEKFNNDEEIRMSVYDLEQKIYTLDGFFWFDIEIDHL